jgi:hypothetical protein
MQIFNQPVNTKLEGLPDYHLIIERPMDLGTIKRKLSSKVYSSPNEFVDDVHLTFANAKKYNAETHEVYHIALMLEAIFEDWWKNITTKMDMKIKGDDDDDGGGGGGNNNVWSTESCPTSEVKVLSLASKKNDRRSQPRMQKKSPKPPKPHPSDPHKRQMRPEERDKLIRDLESLPADKVECVANILESRQNPSKMLEESEEIVIEVDDIDNDTLWELDRFVTNYKKSRGKKKT